MQESNNWLKSFFMKPSPFASKGIEVKGMRKVIFVLYSLFKPMFIIIILLWGIVYLSYISIHCFYIISNIDYIDMNLETLYSLVPDICLILLAIITGIRYSKLYFKYRKMKQQKL